MSKPAARVGMFVMACAVVVAGPVAAQSQPALSKRVVQAQTADPRELARRFYAEVVNQRKFDRLSDYIAADYVQHAPGLAPGRDGVAQFLTFITTAMPDIRTEVQHLALDRNTLIAVVKWSGTHTGPFGKVPASGRPVSFTVAEVFRVKAGKFTEHWSVVDQTDMLVTLGLLMPVQLTDQASGKGIDGVVDAGAKLVRLADGFKHTEGPVWAPTGMLLFSDVAGDQMFSWSGDKARVFRSPSGYANGNTFDRQGNLYTAQHDRRITRTDTAGTVTTLAERYEGKRLNSPNDLVVRDDGTVYFTDPPFGLMGYGPTTGESELNFSGVFRVSPNGTVTLLSRELKFPNGIAFAPDQKTLYVNDGGNSRIYAFAVNADGSLGPARLFADLSIAGKEPFADGMKVDDQGRLYAANHDGVWVYSPLGQLLGKIDVPERVANLAFGGAKGTTLFIAAGTGLYQVDLRARGVIAPTGGK